MKKLLLVTLLGVTLTGCASVNTTQLRTWSQPETIKAEVKVEETLPMPGQAPLAVAVYNFRDMTGQRKSQQNIASLSSAVTQGADNYLVNSLQELGQGRWFKVVERGGLDNLVKERQLIRQMRELYQGADAQPLPPMLFAGILLEGGIVGYDSNIISGGNGARLLGIGVSTEYRQDEIVISLRAVSVSSGEVLASVLVKKTVASVQDRLGVLRFYELGTQAFELESGAAANESMNYATQLAVRAAVVELIKEGVSKGHWTFADTAVLTQPTTIQVDPKVAETVPQEVVKEEEKKEEKKEETKPES